MFNGKPQALPANFAYACGSPLNENDQYIMKSTPVASAIRLTKCDKSRASDHNFLPEWYRSGIQLQPEAL
jgi:hypothetical protein